MFPDHTRTIKYLLAVMLVAVGSSQAWAIEPPDVTRDEVPPRGERGHQSPPPPTDLHDDDELVPNRGGEHGRTPHGDSVPGKRVRDSLWNRLDDNHKNEIREFLREKFPPVYADLFEREQDPKRFSMKISRVLPDVMRLMQVIVENPELGELAIREHRLEMDQRRIAMRYHRSRSPEAQAQLREELVQVVKDLLAIKHQRREKEIETLELRLQELKGELAAWGGQQDQLVEEQVNAQLSRRPFPAGKRPPPPPPHEDDVPE